MELTSHAGGARALWTANLPAAAVGLAWLGQAGFALRHADHRLLIDPYLSDHLARKYAGQEFPHARMMPAPVSAEEIDELDLVLCSHRHSDHTDPGSLPTLAANNPDCRFVMARAELHSAIALGLNPAKLIPVSDGDSLRASEAITIEVLPSAHERLEVNAHGDHHFLGFILKLGRLTLYHAGDCVVYEGLAGRLGSWRIDLALLPVNGRSARLTARGIAGNMTFQEARELCLAAGIRAMMPHHFGMFAFNTVDVGELQRQAAQSIPGWRCLVPSVDRYFLLTPATSTSTPAGP
jgi:L-ascorbate metabolism protein UlaG (beta-lactamase superfamily)